MFPVIGHIVCILESLASDLTKVLVQIPKPLLVGMNYLMVSEANIFVCNQDQLIQMA